MRRAISRKSDMIGFLLGSLAVLLFLTKLVMPQVAYAGAMGAMADDLMVICGSDGAKLVRILPSGEAEDFTPGRDTDEPCLKCLTCDWCATAYGGDTLAAVDMTFPKPEIGPQHWRINSDATQVHVELIVPQERGPPQRKPFSIWASAPRFENASGHSSIKAPA